MARDNRIYGIDELSYARRVAGAALGVPDEDSYSGSPTGEEGAKGNVPSNDKGPVTLTKLGLNGADKACVSGNHGKQGCND